MNKKIKEVIKKKIKDFNLFMAAMSWLALPIIALFIVGFRFLKRIKNRLIKKTK